jgi:DNA processing protein
MTGHELAVAAGRVAADGSDPELLARVVAWACGPRRQLDGLRRQCLRASDGCTTGLGPDAAQTLLDRVLGRDVDAPLAAVATRLLARWHDLGARIALIGDRAYPPRLAEGWPTLDAPMLVVWRGLPPGDAGPGIAIVGARSASDYGTGIATLLARAVADAGGRVVSGGAVGVDAAAHEGALGRPGGTTVVLGCGHAVAYPAAHARRGGLFDRILDDGGTLLSELLPDVAPHPGVIRARNRILAGLSDAVVVVEGGARSGALLTATAAAERGRSVLAVPGDIGRPGSAAPNRLLAEGAHPCVAPRDLTDLLPAGARRSAGPAQDRPLPTPPPSSPQDPPPDPAGLPAAALRTLQAAWPRGLSLDDLAAVSEGPVGPLLAALTRARVAGIVEDTGEGVRLTRPSDR